MMKRLIIVFFLVAICRPVVAADLYQKPVQAMDSLSGIMHYIGVGVPPHFGENHNDFMEYVLERAWFSDDYLQSAGYHLRFLMQFIVDGDGNVVAPRIYGKSREEYTDAEEMLIGILADMPAWTPGRDNGRSVPVMMFFPIDVDFKQ